MNRRYKKAIKKAAGVGVLVAFCVMLYLTSAVEQGAALALMLWAVPVLCSMAACVGIYNRI